VRVMRRGWGRRTGWSSWPNRDTVRGLERSRAPRRGGLGRGSAESAVDLMEASLFRSFAAANGLRPPEAARGTRAIDGRKTSEAHASIRSTASRVTERGGAAPVRAVWRRLRMEEYGNSYPVPVRAVRLKALVTNERVQFVSP
jgi:hypothetical protein